MNDNILHDPSQPITKRWAVKAQDAALAENTITVKAAGIGNIDSHGDVIFPGAFSPEVIAEFLRSGFVPLAHEWDDLPVAMPTMCEERDRGLYSEAKFHSTQEAQDVRTVVKERLEAGLSVGVSVGFFCASDGMIHFPNGQALLDYARGKGLDMALFDLPAIMAWDDHIWAIVKIAKLAEWSIVTIPANSEAEAMSAKAGRQPLRTIRELEDLLRDAGFPTALAKASISNLRAHLRDAGPTEVQPPVETPTNDKERGFAFLSLSARAAAAGVQK